MCDTLHFLREIRHYTGNVRYNPKEEINDKKRLVSTIFEQLLARIPLELFVLVGTFIEEAISPIPSFVVLVPAGAATQARGLPVEYLALLVIISCVGRVLGGLLIYFLADKLENLIFGDGRTFFGTTHAQVEQAGAKLKRQKGSRLWLALFLMHAIPVFPSAMLSLAAGFIRIDVSTFITSMFAGSIINTLFFLCVGYFGFQSAELFSNIETATTILAVIVATVALWYLWKYMQNKKQKRKKRS